MRPAPVTRLPVRRHRRHRPRYRLRRPGRLLGLLLLLMIVGGCAYWGMHGFAILPVARSEDRPVDPAGDAAPTTAPVVKAPPRDVVWVLLLGVDERKGDRGRADAILLARVDRKGRKVYLISLPRDTQVTLGEHGVEKLNAAYAYGGVELTRRTVEGLIGEDVAYYVKVNLEGFRKVVDLLGGVTVHVDRPMHYHDPYQNLSIDLEPGVRTLNGEQALHFVRFRLSDDGRHDDDLKRGERQRQLLKALVAQTMTPGNLVRLPELLETAAQYVETNIPGPEQLALAQALFSARDQVFSVAAPGEPRTDAHGVWYFALDAEQLRRWIRNWSAH